MKTLILLAFAMIANVFAGETQEMFCGDKSLSYCINHFDRQCEAKKYGACLVTGGLHIEQEQYGEAKKYNEMVCDKANSKDSYRVELISGGMIEFSAIISMQDGCNKLGQFYYNGEVVRQSYEKALHYFKKACDLGGGYGCAGVGVVYYDKEDLKSAVKFAAKACELKSGRGCTLLGVMYQYGYGVKQNLPKAKELHGKACDLGFQGGCDEYKELKEKGY